MENLTSQNEELLALQSIFDDEDLTIEHENPPRGRLVVNVSLPRNFRICYNSEKRDGEENSFLTEHLPPLNLFFEFPETYPSETCPAFLLSCSWLRLDQLSKVCQELESIWEKGQGEVVLFEWMNFLQTEVLNLLQITEALDVTKISRYKHNSKYLKNLMGQKNVSYPMPTDSLNMSKPSNSTSTKDAVENSFEFHDTENANERLDSMSVRGLRDSMKPSTSRGSGLFDQRAVLDLTNGLISLLREYNKYKIQKIFESMWFTCLICFASKTGKEFMVFRDCDHKYCRTCLTSYFEIQIRDGNVGSLNCPEEKCPSQADGSQVKDLVSPESFMKYDSLLLSRTLEGMSDIAYCPRRDCQCAVLIEPESTMGCCPACKFIFCILCRMVYHGIAPCNFKKEKHEQIFKAYLKSKGKERADLERVYGKKVLQLLTENMLSEEWKEEYSKKCPHCNANIEKTAGCNKMTCFRCGSYFCWLCSEKLKTSNPYLHFSNPASRCFNLLFPDMQYDEDEFVEAGAFLENWE